MDDFWTHVDDELSTGPGDIYLHLDGGTNCAWSAELKWIPHSDNSGAPDRGYTYFAVGGATPIEVADRVLRAWRADTIA